MRYDDWDVIVFPRDSHIPVQEFKTACYVTQDKYGHHLPTLTCYIASLPQSIPFRVSIHLWSLKAKPSAVIEARRNSRQRVVYTTQIIVDGVLVFHDFFEATAWPQELAYEKRLTENPRHVSSQRKLPLEFPSFHPNILMQSSWNAREDSGRIKVLLSEQLSGESFPDQLVDGMTNDIVCFSFQHAPRDILEQAGISWPIRNPLYLPFPSESYHPSFSTSFSYTHPRSMLTSESPLTKSSVTTPFARPQNPEPFARPKSELSHLSHFRQPTTEGKSRSKAMPRGETVSSSSGNNFDDASMDTWSTNQSTSASATDASMSDIMFASPPFFGDRSSWPNPSKYHQEKDKGRHDTRDRQKPMVVTVREDQFGQLIEVLSPRKRGHGSEPRLNSHSNEDESNTFGLPAHAYPPKMGPTGIPINTKPSAAALARTASYPELHPHMRTMSHFTNKPDATKVYDDAQKSPGMLRPSFSGKENRVPTPYPFDMHVPAPHPYVHGPSQVRGPKYASCGLDVSMRDHSSMFSGLSRLENTLGTTGKSSPALTPAASGNVKSRKEGMRMESPASGLGHHDIRRDPSPLPNPQHAKTSENYPADVDQHAGHRSVVGPSDQEKEHTAFVPGHRSGMESLDSIGRVEKQLFSALGEELNPSFHQNSQSHEHSNHDMDVEQTLNASPGFLSGLEHYGDSPVPKRKRRGTFSTDRNRSPAMKMVREGMSGVSGEMDMDGDVNVPNLRGD
ncbi:hypothetical protein K504DRAFT_530532 [Pleomassaria siparia CBS 279.74]|uniref:Uncharacterized protein n=1 Tax=Pleomassaria siparia CBS 279.74 TaxID=1314801 RepID=A0A6G1KL93_9PLEO|nr:hypothetical protein K504DRAFT_530532 [Pleomassaria siparia CBS 279.74]